MTLESVLALGRARHRDLFRATCTITRGTGSPVFDPVTGTYTPAASSTVYSGPCNVGPRSLREVQAGEEEAAVVSYSARLPVDTDVERGDTLTVDSCVYDDGLVGRVFTVTGVAWWSWQIARVATLEIAT